MYKNGVYRVSPWLKFLRGFLRGIFRAFFSLLLRLEFEGFENVPESGPYIIAYNHTSLLEPPVIIAFWPTHPEALSGQDVWNRPGQGQLVRWYRATPVKRGRYDRKVFDIMAAQLEAGQAIAIAPEGGQSSNPQMRQANAGIAYLIEKMNVPVIPVAVSGSYKGIVKDIFRGKRPRITVKVGKLFVLPPITGKGQIKKEARQKNADEVMIQIARMLPDRYHGYYSGKVNAK